MIRCSARVANLLNLTFTSSRDGAYFLLNVQNTLIRYLSKKGKITETETVTNMRWIWKFEGIMHSNGHNSWETIIDETQTKATVFVMQHYVCEQWKKINLRWYVLWWCCNIYITLEWGAHIGIGALINKKKHIRRGWLIRKGVASWKEGTKSNHYGTHGIE